MSKLFHGDNHNDDNNDAKAIAIPQVFFDDSRAKYAEDKLKPVQMIRFLSNMVENNQGEEENDVTVSPFSPFTQFFKNLFSPRNK